MYGGVIMAWTLQGFVLTRMESLTRNKSFAIKNIYYKCMKLPMPLVFWKLPNIERFRDVPLWMIQMNTHVCLLASGVNSHDVGQRNMKET
mgnify:CR=1 FL=1